MLDLRNWKFQALPFAVHDVIRVGEDLLLASESGIVKLPEHASGQNTTLIIVGVVILVASALFWWWWHRFPTVIFISYRRGDSRDAVGRIGHKLVATFGKRHVRVDVQDIKPGIDYRAKILRGLQESQVVLVIIGPSWLTAKGKDGSLRLFAERDDVRYEIETALSLHKSIIPVLLADTNMPPEDELPKSICQLSFLESTRLRHDPDFDLDLSALVKVIRSSASTSQKKAQVVSLCGSQNSLSLQFCLRRIEPINSD